MGIDEDEVLIQPMLQNVTMSGVLFTQDPRTGAPYYIINYNLEGDTTAVTSGKSACEAHIVARSVKNLPNEKFEKLVSLARELEIKLKDNSLDIEFAFDKEGSLFLLQVRHLILNVECVEAIEQR
ncbi:MAG: hypothetical protein GY915_05270, partial [bacterium]|nr:hypothetical protein [bacterium]